MINKQSGSSIVQVLMVTFFLMSAGLSLADAIRNQTKQVKHWTQKSVLNDLEHSLLAAAQDAPTCELNLNSVINPALTFNGTVAAPTMNLPRILSGPVLASHVIAQANQEVNESGVFVDTIQLGDFIDVGGGNWTARWRVTFQPTGADLVAFKPIVIGPKTFRVDATDINNIKITNCVASGGNPWVTTGNAPVPAAVNYSNYYLGTTTDVDIVIRRNNNLVGLLNRSIRRTQLGVDTIPELSGAADLTALGFGALGSNSTGTENVAVGDYALTANTTGQKNTAAGSKSLRSNVSGNNNTAVGARALTASTVGDTTAIGNEALTANTTGTNNSAVGSYALHLNTTGSRNMAIGSVTFWNAVISASDNIAIGTDSSTYTQADRNIAMGSWALGFATNGINNIAAGSGALGFASANALENVAVGSGSGSGGSLNTSFGSGALNSIWNENVAIGSGSIGGGSFVRNTVAVGSDTLQAMTVAEFVTAAGYRSSNVGNNRFNSTSIGANSQITGSNMVILGDGAITNIEGSAPYFNMSDVRLKRDITSYKHGLDLILNLRPVTYSLKSDKSAKIHSGFIAQEVEETGVPFYGLNKPADKDGFYSIAYAEFVVPLVNAVKELFSTLADLKSRLMSQSERIERLERLAREHSDPQEVPIE